jgi:hypothetical protein
VKDGLLDLPTLLSPSPDPEQIFAATVPGDAVGKVLPDFTCKLFRIHIRQLSRLNMDKLDNIYII